MGPRGAWKLSILRLLGPSFPLIRISCMVAHGGRSHYLSARRQAAVVHLLVGFPHGGRAFPRAPSVSVSEFHHFQLLTSVRRSVISCDHVFFISVLRAGCLGASHTVAGTSASADFGAPRTSIQAHCDLPFPGPGIWCPSVLRARRRILHAPDYPLWGSVCCRRRWGALTSVSPVHGWIPSRWSSMRPRVPGPRHRVPHMYWRISSVGCSVLSGVVALYV